MGQAELLGREHRTEVDLVADHDVGPDLYREVEHHPGPGRRRPPGEAVAQHPFLVLEPGHDQGPDRRGLLDIGTGPAGREPSPSTTATIEGRQANVTAWPAATAARAIGTSGS